MVDAFVNKQRAKAGNLVKLAETPKKDAPESGVGGMAPAAVDDRAAKPAGGQ